MSAGIARIFALLAVTLTVFAQEPQRGNTAKVEEMRTAAAAALAKGDARGAQKLLTGGAVAQSAITTYEEIRSCGFYAQETRLACAIEIKRQFGYGGDIGGTGTFEYVSFYVDFNQNGTFDLPEYVGSGIAHIADGSSGTNLAVYRDFNPPGGLRTTNSGASTTTMTSGPILKARAILRWGLPVCDPNEVPFFGNVFDFSIRMAPIR